MWRQRRAAGPPLHPACAPPRCTPCTIWVSVASGQACRGHAPASSSTRIAPASSPARRRHSRYCFGCCPRPWWRWRAQVAVLSAIGSRRLATGARESPTRWAIARACWGARREGRETTCGPWEWHTTTHMLAAAGGDECQRRAGVTEVLSILQAQAAASRVVGWGKHGRSTRGTEGGGSGARGAAREQQRVVGRRGVSELRTRGGRREGEARERAGRGGGRGAHTSRAAGGDERAGGRGCRERAVGGDEGRTHARRT